MYMLRRATSFRAEQSVRISRRHRFRKCSRFSWTHLLVASSFCQHALHHSWRHVRHRFRTGLDTSRCGRQLL